MRPATRSRSRSKAASCVTSATASCSTRAPRPPPIRCSWTPRSTSTARRCSPRVSTSEERRETMKIQKTLLVMALLACGPATTVLAARNLVVNTGGQMRIQLDLPLAEDVDITVPVTHGRLELLPIAIVPGSARFYLNNMSLSFGDFQIHRLLYGDHDF